MLSPTRQLEEDPVPVYQVRPPHKSVQHAIWDPDDAFIIRKTHRLLGDFVGTLPKHLSQNQFLTLPLLLNQEEVAHGMAQGVLKPMTDDPRDYAVPSSTAVRSFLEEREISIQRQVEGAVEEHRKERRRRKVNTLPGLKRKRSELDIPVVKDSSDDVNENGDCVNHTSANTVALLQEPPTKVPRLGILPRISRTFFSIINHFMPMPSQRRDPSEPTASGQEVGSTTSSDDEAKEKNDSDVPIESDNDDASECWRINAREKVLDEKSRRQAQMSCLISPETAARNDEVRKRKPAWDISTAGVSSERLRTRHIVFEDLHRRGYFLSCGAKFGADFLAYAGDPQLFHSALAVVVVNGDNGLTARDIVALGRLGDSTRKRIVLGWPTNLKGSNRNGTSTRSTVNYIGIQWEETLP